MARNKGMLHRSLDHSNKITIVSCALYGLYTQSACVVATLFVSIIVTLSAKVIKRVLRQPRPSISGKTTYGMPSTHSTAIWFLFTSFAIAWASFPLHPNLPESPVIRQLGFVSLLVWTLLVSWSRISLGHHNILQIAAGTAYGTICAVAWMQCWTHGLHDVGVEIERAYVELRTSLLR